MLRLNPIDDYEITPEIRGILANLKNKPAETPNFLRVLARSSASLAAYAGAENALAHGQLTVRQRKQIALAVAEINGSKYCVANQLRNSKDRSLSEQEIQLARRAMALDAKSSAMLHFTLAVVVQRGEVKDDDLRIMRDAGFSDAEIIEVIANIVLNIFTNYFNLISRTESDSPAQLMAGGAKH
jgi:uncharacterized peroxidase-related enzyme